MKLKRALVSLGLTALVYVAALAWVDSRSGVLGRAPALASCMPVLLGAAVFSWLLRYARWHWLLRRAGHQVPAATGLIAFLSGFAFTATPGKVGELVRIRYLEPLGVPAERVIAAFVYERALDLVAVLAIAMLAAVQFDIIWVAAGFVAAVLGAVAVLACRPQWLRRMSARVRLLGLEKLSRIGRTLGNGLARTGTWANPLDVAVSLTLGCCAWGSMCLSFLWLLAQFDLQVPAMTAVALYPLSMLVGAASMLPGGIGTTEASLVGLLVLCGVSIDLAVLAAVGMRVSTLWSSVITGMVALLVLETRRAGRIPKLAGSR